MRFDSQPVRRHGLKPSRRQLLGAAGAGIIVSVLSHRDGLLVQAQDAFPTRVQVLHAAPGLGQVEVLFNGDELLDEFDYGQTSDWLDIAPGTLRVTIRLDRFGFNYAVFDAVYPVPVDNDYHLIISSPLLIPTAVDRAPLAADTSRVRVVQASVGTPPVDVAIAGGDVLLEELGYGQLSDPAEVPSGTYDLELRLHDSGEVVLEVPGATVEPGMTYTAVLYGTPGSGETPLTFVLLGDEVEAGAPVATPTA
jgi:hypothetical protein